MRLKKCENRLPGGGLGGDSEGLGGDLANKGDPELPGDDFWMRFGGHEDPNESDMGAKWEPNAVKMLTNIVAKFAIDLGGHFGAKKV